MRASVRLGYAVMMTLLVCRASAFAPPSRKAMRERLGEHLATENKKKKNELMLHSSLSLAETILSTSTTSVATATATAAAKTATSSTAAKSAAAAALTLFASPIGALAVLAAVVLVHESGHFLAARLFGISVKEFSVGVGPKIAGFVSSNKNEQQQDEEGEDGIEFNLRALPLGGYVRFPENYDTALALQQQKEKQQIRNKRQQQIRAKKTQTMKFDILGIKRKFSPIKSLPTKEKKTSFLPSFFRSSKTMKKEDSTSKSTFARFFTNTNNKNNDDDEGNKIVYFDDPNLLQNRPWIQRAIVLSGGIIFNIALAFVLYFGELTIGDGLPTPVFKEGAVISFTPASDAPSNGILKRGDVIIGVNGNRLWSTSSPSAVQSQQAISKLITTIRETPEGEDLQLSILRQQQQQNQQPLRLAPITSKQQQTKSSSSTTQSLELVVRPRRVLDASTNRVGPASIGAVLSPNYIRTELVKAPTVTNACTMAATEVYDQTLDTATGLYDVLRSFVKGRGVPPGQTLSGPVGLLRTGSEVVSTSNLSAVGAFAAALSINLAVINAFPLLPALDGGQLLFVFAEAISGKKVDQRFQEELTAAAFLFLLLLSLGTVVGDVSSIIDRR